MKTKLYYLLCLLVSVPFLFVSCSDTDENAEATLEVSMDPVNFVKAGGEQKITITTNQEKWLASSPLEVSWLTLSQSGSELTVKAAANTGGTDRKGYILVNAGTAVAKINVMQSAGDVLLNLSAEKAAFVRKGGELRIGVVSSGTFKVEVEATAQEWLKAAHMEGTDYFTVSAASNPASEARTAKIQVTAGSTTKELVVSQEGRELVMLPCLAEELPIGKIITFEQERGGIMVKVPDGVYDTDQYHFLTTHPDFPLIIYQCPDKLSRYTQATVATNKSELCKGEKFEAYLKANGFEKNGEDAYLHKNSPYQLKVSFEGGGAVMQISYMPKQDKDYPTFKELPLNLQKGWTGLFQEELHGSKFEVAEAYEKKEGTVVYPAMTQLPDFAWYNVSNSDISSVARVYWMYTADSGDESPVEYYNEICAVRELFTRIDLVFWQEGTVEYMTREFEKLLADNKYTFLGTNREGFRFYINGKDVLLFSVAYFGNFMEGVPLLDFQTYKQTEDNTPVSLLTDMGKRTKFFKDAEKRIQKMKKMQAR